MPVQEQTPYIKYVANGVTQTFSTEFDCESKDQLVVMLNGEEPAFTSWSYADKQVTFVTAPVVDTVVELKRQSKLNRTTDYQSFNHTLNYKALNSDFDRIWYAIQEQNYKAGQYDYDYNFVLTQVRPISTGGTGADNATSARNNLNVYSNGQVDALVATGGQGSVVSIDGGGTGADNAEEARANLDVYSQAEVDFKIDEATPNATTTIKGVVRLATESDITNSSETAVVTPKNVNDMLVGVGASAKGFRALFSARLTQMTGTNTSSGKTITCTITAHGLSVGDVVSVNYRYLFFNNNNSATDTVTVTSVANADTFTFTSPQNASGSASAGACTLYYAIKNNYNVNSLAINSVGRYTVSINTASGIKDTSFIPFIEATTSDNSVVLVQPEAITSATSLTVRTFDASGAAITPQWLHIGVTQ